MEDRLRRQLKKLFYQPIHPGALLEQNFADAQKIQAADRGGYEMGFADALAFAVSLPETAKWALRQINAALATTCETSLSELEDSDAQVATQFGNVCERWRPYLDIIDREYAAEGPAEAGA